MDNYNRDAQAAVDSRNQEMVSGQIDALEEWSDRYSQALDKIGELGIDTGFITKLIGHFQQLSKEVIQVDSAMAELSRNSSASANEVRKYFDEAAKSAKVYGTSVSGMINATAGWSSLGYSLPDAKALAEAAAVYSNIGEGVDRDAANEALSAALQGFRLKAEDAMGVIDRFHEAAGSFQMDPSGISEALQRSADSLYASNTDLSKSMALIAGSGSSVGDPAAIGELWKTVGMRIRGAKQELEAAGETTDGMAASTDQLRGMIQDSAGFDIMAGGTQLKDVYDIITGIGHVWGNLTDDKQSALLGALAGEGHGDALRAALDNVSLIEDAYRTVENSSGSALQGQWEYEQGIQYSLDRLEASYQAFANHVLDSGLVKGFADLGNGAVNALDAITSKLGALGTLGLGAGLFAGVKNTGKRRTSVRISGHCCFGYALHA